MTQEPTLLQLLSKYYESVIESEKVYYTNLPQQLSPQLPSPNKQQIPSSPGKNNDIPSDNDLITLLLQKQVNKLTAQVQSLTKEKDDLESLNKSQRLISEKKTKNYQKTIKDLEDKLIINNQIINSEDEDNIMTTPKKKDSSIKKEKVNKPRFHLLSPLSKSKRGNGNNNNNNSKEGNGIERSRGSSHTIFDDSSSESLSDFDGEDDSDGNNETARKTHSVDSFVLSLKKYDDSRSNLKREKVLSQGKVNDNELNIKRLNEQKIPNLNRKIDNNQSNSQSPNLKKRKLSKKKIQVTSDNEMIASQ